MITKRNKDQFSDLYLWKVQILRTQETSIRTPWSYPIAHLRIQGDARKSTWSIEKIKVEEGWNNLLDSQSRLLKQSSIAKTLKYVPSFTEDISVRTLGSYPPFAIKMKSFRNLLSGAMKTGKSQGVKC